MKRAMMVVAALALAGCSASQVADREPANFVTPVQAARCDLDGMRAAAAQLNGMIAGAERGRVTQQCLRVASLENMEEARRAAGAPEGDPGTAQKIAGLAEGCGASPPDNLRDARARLVATPVGAAEWEAGVRGGRSASPGACAFARGVVLVAALQQREGVRR